MKTKEEIEAQIDILEKFINLKKSDFLNFDNTALTLGQILGKFCSEIEILKKELSEQKGNSFKKVMEDLIIENQGLKMYKDNEKERLKEAFNAGINSGLKNLIYQSINENEEITTEQDFEDFINSKK